MLGSVLHSAGAMDDAALRLTPDDFFDQANATVFRQMLAMHDLGKPVDMRLLIERLRSAKAGDKTEYEAIGGASYFVALGRAVITPAHGAHYAEIVRSKSSLRQLQIAANGIFRETNDPAADPDELAQRFEETLTELAARRMHHQAAVVDLTHVVAGALERIYRRQETGKGEGLPTGYAKIDEMTGGLRAGELAIIAARPSQGKSALMANVCENVAVGARKQVLLVSLEMSGLDIADRMLAAQSGVKLWRMRNGSITEHEREKVIEAASKVADAPLSIDSPPSRSASEIASLARKAKRAGKLDLLAVDYVQLIRPDNPRDPREQQVSKAAWRLKTLARELDVPVVVAAQLNRLSEQGNRRPRLSDLRESGALEQHADMVWLIHWPDGKPGESEAAEIDVAKQRNGPTGIVKLQWQRDFVRFNDEPATQWDEHRSNWVPESMREDEGF